jgi:hypothetical protein
MTKKTAAKKAAVKKSSNISCPVLKKILSFSPEELNERSRLKRMKKKEKREKAKLRKAEDQSRAEEEAKNSASSSPSSSSNGEAAAVVTIKKKQLPPPPKLPVELLPYLHKSHSYDKDKVPASVKESFRYTGQVRMY